MGMKSIVAVLVCTFCVGWAAFAQTQVHSRAIETTHQGDENSSPTLQSLEARIVALEAAIGELNGNTALSTATPGLIPFEEVILNLNTPTADLTNARYLKLSIVFDVSRDNEQSASAAVERVKPKLLDQLIAITGELTAKEVLGTKKLNKFRTVIRDAFNAELKAAGDEPYIQSVLFNQLNVQ